MKILSQENLKKIKIWIKQKEFVSDMLFYYMNEQLNIFIY